MGIPGTPSQLQAACIATGGARLPVAKKARHATDPKTDVYSAWNRQRKMTGRTACPCSMTASKAWFKCATLKSSGLARATMGGEQPAERRRRATQPRKTTSSTIGATRRFRASMWGARPRCGGGLPSAMLRRGPLYREAVAKVAAAAGAVLPAESSGRANRGAAARSMRATRATLQRSGRSMRWSSLYGRTLPAGSRGNGAVVGGQGGTGLRRALAQQSNWRWPV